ncbi:MAG TPA: SCO family protein [Myxococcales bacterium]|jgi:protein SCO1/2|nr:SCO family protein [Myxococcales bacterium]
MITNRQAALVAVLLALPATADPAAERVQKQRTYFTDTELVTQDGARVRFFSDVLRDQVVVIHFIFTHCPDACPLLTQKLVQAKAKLGDALGHGVRFVSISVDPSRDGPSQLHAFAKKQGALHPGWTFLSGDEQRVELVRKKLGDISSSATDHSTAFIAGNTRTGHWTRLRPDISPDLIAEEVQRLRADVGDAGSRPAAANRVP